jgi:hypothetical protein
MDVFCTTCREPWDADHLLHEAIFETDLTDEEARSWRGLPHGQKLNERYREKFKEAGWEFGRSVINIVHCPCCPPGATPDHDLSEIKAALEDLLGDDEDGLAATFEDYDL